MSLKSISELAEMTGCSTRTVRRRCEGLPTQPGPKNSILFESAPALDKIYGGGSRSELDKERTRLARAQAEKTEIEVEVMRDNLVTHERVEREVSQMIIAARSRLLALPTSLAPLLCHEDDPAQIEALIRDRVHEALTELSEWEPADA